MTCLWWRRTHGLRVLLWISILSFSCHVTLGYLLSFSVSQFLLSVKWAYIVVAPPSEAFVRTEWDNRCKRQHCPGCRIKVKPILISDILIFNCFYVITPTTTCSSRRRGYCHLITWLVGVAKAQNLSVLNLNLWVDWGVAVILWILRGPKGQSKWTSEPVCKAKYKDMVWAAVVV